jgi:hypothetical protein
MAEPNPQEKAIVPVPVAPLVTPEKAAEQWKLFEALKAKLLSEDDYQTIAKKRYIKRSGFRKIAVYFGISDRIVKEERIDREDGTFSWRIIVEAVAPNARNCVGVGACDSRERKFAHLEHDVYATAHTRAKSRAISDLVAGGAVSAEEVSETSPTETAEPEPTTERQKCQEVPATKDVVNMPGLRQYPLTDGLKAVGMLNVLNDEVSIVPEKPLEIEGPKGTTIISFFIPRVIEPLCNKHNFSYTVAKTPDNTRLLHIIITGKLTDDQIKELQAAARWAFAKAVENANQDRKDGEKPVGNRPV